MGVVEEERTALADHRRYVRRIETYGELLSSPSSTAIWAFGTLMASDLSS